MFKEISFDDLPQVDSISLDVEIDYTYEAQTTSTPVFEEADVRLPSNYKELILARYQEAANAAIAEIENTVDNILIETIRDWAMELRKGCAESRFD